MNPNYRTADGYGRASGCLSVLGNNHSLTVVAQNEVVIARHLLSRAP